MYIKERVIQGPSPSPEHFVVNNTKLRCLSNRNPVRPLLLYTGKSVALSSSARNSACGGLDPMLTVKRQTLMLLYTRTGSTFRSETFVRSRVGWISRMEAPQWLASKLRDFDVMHERDGIRTALATNVQSFGLKLLRRPPRTKFSDHISHGRTEDWRMRNFLQNSYKDHSFRAS